MKLGHSVKLIEPTASHGFSAWLVMTVVAVAPSESKDGTNATLEPLEGGESYTVHSSNWKDFAEVISENDADAFIESLKVSDPVFVYDTPYTVDWVNDEDVRMNTVIGNTIQVGIDNLRHMITEGDISRRYQ